MDWASRFDELASGRRLGLAAGALRGLLSVAAAPYALGVAARNWRYD